MAINTEIVVPGLPSIYSSDRNKSKRNLKIHYSIPDKGINDDTGILLYIAGFRGYPTAKVFTKLRNNFADEYNLITIQCDYFGSEFMQKSKLLRPQDKHMAYFSKQELIKIYKRGKFNIDTFFEICSKYELKMLLREDLSEECEENFNEMGIMQAMDNLNALLTVMKKVNDEGHVFNNKKIIFYGNSHGSYLAHLCNVLAPDLATCIIDNSGWIFPRHIFKDSRHLTQYCNKTKLKLVFDYKARDIVKDFQIFDLDGLYKGFSNNAKIIAYHGAADHLISLEEKSMFINSINNAEIRPILDENLVEYEGVFASTKHGLDANFLKLFKHVMSKENIKFEKDTNFRLPKNRYIETDFYRYIFDYSNDTPAIVRCEKEVTSELSQIEFYKMFKKSNLYKDDESSSEHKKELPEQNDIKLRMMDTYSVNKQDLSE